MRKCRDLGFLIWETEAMSQLKMFAAIFTTVAVTTFGIALAQEPLSLESVAIRLYLEKSGQLSSDITRVENFSARNGAPIGNGFPSDEIFEGFFIELHFSSKGEVFAKGRQATVTIVDDKTKKRLVRQVISDVYVDAHGKVVKPIFITDQNCGPLIVTVTSHVKTFANKLDFSCSE